VYLCECVCVCVSERERGEREREREKGGKEMWALFNLFSKNKSSEQKVDDIIVTTRSQTYKYFFFRYGSEIS